MEFRNAQGKVIGTLEGGVFVKRASYKKHFMKIFDAWGIDSPVVQKLQGKCSEIRIKDMDSDKVWVVPFEVFLANAFEKNFGHGKQMFLSRQHWTIRANGVMVQDRVPTKQEKELKTLKLI